MMTRDLAVAIATGNAGATFELLSKPPANGKAKLDGRFWYAGGRYRNSGEPASAVDRLAELILKHPTAQAEAVWREAAAITKADGNAFAAQPEPVQLAFETFVAVLKTMAPLVPKPLPPPILSAPPGRLKRTNQQGNRKRRVGPHGRRPQA